MSQVAASGMDRYAAWFDNDKSALLVVSVQDPDGVARDGRFMLVGCVVHLVSILDNVVGLDWLAIDEEKTCSYRPDVVLLFPLPKFVDEDVEDDGRGERGTMGRGAFYYMVLSTRRGRFSFRGRLWPHVSAHHR